MKMPLKVFKKLLLRAFFCVLRVNFLRFARQATEIKNTSEMKKLLASDIPAKEKIRTMYYYATEFLIKEYKLTSSITKHILLNRDLSKGLNSLPFITEHYKGRRSEQECKIIAYNLTSMMQLAIYRYEDLKNFSGYDLTDKEQLHRYVDLQIDLFLTE